MTCRDDARCFCNAALKDAVAAAAEAIDDACQLFNDRSKFENLRKYILGIDFSWQKSASDYIALYKELT